MKTNAIVYGSLSTGLQKKALETLTEFLLDYTMEYPVALPAEKYTPNDDFRWFFIGTREQNPHIAAFGGTAPTHKEGYRISVKNDTVVIEGCDDAGVLYGCVDFYNKYILKFEFDHHPGRYFRNIFEDTLPDFELASHPDVSDRGIWTWGHVIYDYRGFIDNMVKLKMNTIIVWNDHAPVNAEDFIAYAHDRNVKVIWGFAWLWDTDCNKFNIAALGNAGDEIAEKYRREYAPLNADGIYFQSFTELDKDEIGGVLIAEAVTNFVNETAQKLFEVSPGLELQFGLHATSVKEKLQYLRHVDPRIRIVWENCGSFPFSYIPQDVGGFEETCNFVRTIAHLRGEQENFGVVTKGLVKLDWSAFTHPKGPACFGVSSREVQANRVVRKHKYWKYIQAYWMTYADKAHEMIRLMQQERNGKLVITGLVEDGMFEKHIYFPVALYSEMLWDCTSPTNDLINAVALRDYVDFA